MKKLILRMSLTVFALAAGPFLSYAKMQTCDYFSSGQQVYIQWDVPDGRSCCSPTASLGWGIMVNWSGGSVMEYSITVQQAQRIAGCRPGVYNPF